MVMHDLAHFCMENELCITPGFYGLIGIDILYFESKEKIYFKDLPDEAKVTGLIGG